MKKPFFTGTCTALVTPFLGNQINYPMMEQLLRRQMDAGIHTVVISGTTGESATLSDEEKIELLRRCKDYVGSSMKVIAGTGSNCTEHAVNLSIEAQNAGADGLLVVSPYYNKASNDGLVAHYLSVAHAVRIPVILYNVPSRTGLDIPVSVYKTLSRIPNIAGVKEASTNIVKIAKIRKECGQDFAVWCGNDDMTVPVLSLGGSGVISVASNVAPELVDAMVCAGLDGDFDSASEIQCHLLPLCEALFSDINPIPVKAAMRHLGFDCGNCRLPLTTLSEEKMKNLECCLQNRKYA